MTDNFATNWMFSRTNSKLSHSENRYKSFEDTSRGNSDRNKLKESARRGIPKNAKKSRSKISKSKFPDIQDNGLNNENMSMFRSNNISISHLNVQVFNSFSSDTKPSKQKKQIVKKQKPDLEIEKEDQVRHRQVVNNYKILQVTIASEPPLVLGASSNRCHRWQPSINLLKSLLLIGSTRLTQLGLKMSIEATRVLSTTATS